MCKDSTDEKPKLERAGRLGPKDATPERGREGRERREQRGGPGTITTSQNRPSPCCALEYGRSTQASGRRCAPGGVRRRRGRTGGEREEATQATGVRGWQEGKPRALIRRPGRLKALKRDGHADGEQELLRRATGRAAPGRKKGSEQKCLEKGRRKARSQGDVKGERRGGRRGDNRSCGATTKGKREAGTKYKAARGRRTEKRWGGEATKQEGKEEKAGDGTSPHGGGEVAGRWVLLDGEIPVLVPPLGSHQPDGHQAPMLRWAQGPIIKKTMLESICMCLIKRTCTTGPACHKHTCRFT